MNRITIIVRGPSNTRKSTIIRLCMDALLRAGIKDVLTSDVEAQQMSDEKLASIRNADVQVRLLQANTWRQEQTEEEQQAENEAWCDEVW